MTWTAILLGAVCCIMICGVRTIRDSACLESTAPCGIFSLNCSNGSRIQVDKLMYGTKQGSCQSTYATNCKVEEIGCCASNSNDCFKTFNQNDAKSVLDKCSGRSSCGKLQAVRTSQTQTQTCNSTVFSYFVVDYSCVSGSLYLNLGADITLTESEVNVIFDHAANDTVFRKQPTNYTCTIVQTGYRIVTLELVDIRIQKPGVTQSCSSVRISIPDANFSAECSNVSKQQNLVYTRGSIIQLDNERQTKFSIDNMFKQNDEDYPEMIWIKIKAFPNYAVSVTCRAQEFPNNSGDTANSNTDVIIAVLIPVLFLIGVAIVGVFVFRYRYRHSLEEKTEVESHNEARYESPMGEHNREVTQIISSSIYMEIDASKTANTISATVSQCLQSPNEDEYYLEPSKIPEEFAPRVVISFGGSSNGFHQGPRDDKGSNSKSENAIYKPSSVQYVNTVENKSPKRTIDTQIEKLKDVYVEGKDMSAESKPASDADAMKTTEKVLKVKRSADNYIEFVHGELYDEPQEPTVVHSNDIINGQNNLLSSTANASGEKSDNDNRMPLYEYADPDGATGSLPNGDHLRNDMYEAVGNDLTGIMNDYDQEKEVFTYDYADQKSSSIQCSNNDPKSVANKHMSFDDNYEYIQPPKENSDSMPHNYTLPPQPSSSSSFSSSSSSLPVSHPSSSSSSLSSKISTRNHTYINSPRLKATNKPITASKPNATDGYANSPKLWACKSMPSELGKNGCDLKDKGKEIKTDMLQAVLSVSALKLMFESQENANSFADNVDSES